MEQRASTGECCGARVLLEQWQSHKLYRNIYVPLKSKGFFNLTFLARVMLTPLSLLKNRKANSKIKLTYSHESLLSHSLLIFTCTRTDIVPRPPGRYKGCTSGGRREQGQQVWNVQRRQQQVCLCKTGGVGVAATNSSFKNQLHFKIMKSPVFNQASTTGV